MKLLVGLMLINSWPWQCGFGNVVTVAWKSVTVLIEFPMFVQQILMEKR